MFSATNNHPNPIFFSLRGRVVGEMDLVGCWLRKRMRVVKVSSRKRKFIRHFDVADEVMIWQMNFNPRKVLEAWCDTSIDDDTANKVYSELRSLSRIFDRELEDPLVQYIDIYKNIDDSDELLKRQLMILKNII
jgi:hypothetical protein